MKLTQTNVVFSRIAMVLSLCRNKSSRNDLKLRGNYFWKISKILEEKSTSGGPHPVDEGGGAPSPLGAPPYLVGPLEILQPQLQLYIFAFGEKKIREKNSSRFTIRSRRQALKPLGRADLESVRGSREGNPSPSSSQPSSITNFMMLTVMHE